MNSTAKQTAAEIAALLDALDRAESGARSDRKLLAAGRTRLATLLRRIDRVIAAPDNRAKAPPLTIPVSINQSIQATVADSFGHVQPDGRLYYVKAADCFAFRLAGTLFHGHIGNCGRNAVRTVDCRYGSRCNRRNTCMYYHDPVICGGTDRHDWKIALPQTQCSSPADLRRLRLFAMHILLSALAVRQ